MALPSLRFILADLEKELELLQAPVVGLREESILGVR
jgi:hypothetical protein